ncbi:hypothetical protein ACDQ55_21180, partial [Chitinophaga sp. 30R24]|uniref:DUF6443 domain-containing protein n=1 Tax=Chitinophaga sp. 30R24 TaxID=3248838 RepID=UPI003B8F8470
MFLYPGYLRATVCALMLLLLHAVTAHAAIEPYQQQLQGAIKKGDTLLVKDEKFENPSYNWNAIRNYGVQNVITFGLRTDTLFKLPSSFSCKADLKVAYWSGPGQDQPIIIEHVPLEIKYDTATGAIYQAFASYSFKNAYKVKITVNDISSKELGKLPPIFYLNATVVVNRDYLPTGDQTLMPMLTSAKGKGVMQRDGGAITGVVLDKLPISWDAITGAQQYDLEWTFIDEDSDNGTTLQTAGSNVMASMLAPMFRNNSSRVTVHVNSYEVPMIQEHEYLLIRIRTVDESGDYRKEGPWIYQAKVNGNIVPGVIGATEGVKWFEPGLNWQYNAVYTEDGNRKEVINFFDGTLRNRQSVTVNNSDQKAVVQENVYDVYGRVVGNILPAPLNSPTLQFYKDVNLNAQGQAYSWRNIVKDETGSCIGRPDLLDSSSGTARYYSSNNDILTDPFRKYIPDADGLPLAITTYTADNTGRISMKSGVGPVLQPDQVPADNHATRYYYGKPAQWELDRIFGNDAGYADHYLKNMVVDPNGEVSISYVNDEGKTVATALTGTNPDTSLLALSSRPAPVHSHVTLLQPDRFVFDQQTLKLTATATYLASVPNITDSLEVSLPYLIKRYEQNNVTICSNCYYDLKIKVSDDCNNTLASVNNTQVGSAFSDCSVTGNYSQLVTIPVNKVGEYYVTIELALNTRVIDAYTDDFIKKNTNLRTQFDFVIAQLKKEDFSGCFSECITCKQTLGEKADFVAALVARIAFNGVDVATNTATIEAWAQGLYDILSSNCQALRSSCLGSPCDKLKQQLMLDVKPGGQYALFDDAGKPQETEINILYWQWRKVFPVAVPGSTVYESNKFELEDGTVLSPNSASFTLAQLVGYWRSEWTELFIPYHPEYCGWQFCQSVSSYKAWDQRLEEIYTSAGDLPAVLGGLQYSSTNNTWLLAADPFFASNGAGKDFYNSFRTDLEGFSYHVMGMKDNRMPIKGLSAYVDYLLYCANPNATTNTTVSEDGLVQWSACVPNADCRIVDREWQLYLQLYLKLKEHYYELVRETKGYCKDVCKVGLPAALPVADGYDCDKINDFGSTLFRYEYPRVAGEFRIDIYKNEDFEIATGVHAIVRVYLGTW